MKMLRYSSEQTSRNSGRRVRRIQDADSVVAGCSNSIRGTCQIFWNSWIIRRKGSDWRRQEQG